MIQKDGKKEGGDRGGRSVVTEMMMISLLERVV